jgi:hypothetical protein
MGCVVFVKGDLQGNVKTYWMADGKQLGLATGAHGFVKERRMPPLETPNYSARKCQ